MSRKKLGAVLLAFIMATSMIVGGMAIAPVLAEDGEEDWSTADAADSVIAEDGYVFTAEYDGSETTIRMINDADGTVSDTVTTAEELTAESAFIRANDGDLYLLTTDETDINVQSVGVDTTDDTLTDPATEASAVANADGDALVEETGDWYFSNGGDVTHSTSPDPDASGAETITVSTTDVQGLDVDDATGAVAAAGTGQDVDIITGGDVDETVNMSSTIGSGDIGSLVALDNDIIHVAETTDTTAGAHSLETGTDETVEYPLNGSPAAIDSFERYFSIVTDDGEVQVVNTEDNDDIYTANPTGNGASVDFGEATNTNVDLVVGGDDTIFYDLTVDRFPADDHNLYINTAESDDGDVYNDDGNVVDDPRDAEGDDAEGQVTITEFDNTREDGQIIEYEVEFDSDQEGENIDVLVDVDTSEISPDSYAIYVDGVFEGTLESEDWNNEDDIEAIIENEFEDIDPDEVHTVSLRSTTDTESDTTTFEGSQTHTFDGFAEFVEEGGDRYDLENGEVEATLSDDTGDLRDTATTDANGEFELELDSDRTYDIIVTEPDSESSETLTVTMDSDQSGDFLVQESTGDDEGSVSITADAENSDVVDMSLLNSQDEDLLHDATEGGISDLVAIPGQTHTGEVEVNDPQGLDQVREVVVELERGTPSAIETDEGAGERDYYRFSFDVAEDGTVSLNDADSTNTINVENIGNLDPDATTDSFTFDFDFAEVTGPSANTQSSEDDNSWTMQAGSASNDGDGGTFTITEESDDPFELDFNVGVLLDVEFSSTSLSADVSPGQTSEYQPTEAGVDNFDISNNGNVEISFLTRMTEMTSEETEDVIPADANRYHGVASGGVTDSDSSVEFQEHRQGVMPSDRVLVAFDDGPMDVDKWIDMPEGVDPGEYDGTFTYTVEYEQSGDE